MIFSGEESLWRVLWEYVIRLNRERPYKGIGNPTAKRSAARGSTLRRLVAVHERLGDLLRHERASA